MKHSVWILLGLVLAVLPAAAQVRLGVRAGGAYSTMVYKVDNLVESGDRFGYSLAAVADIPVWKEFSLRPELSFVSQGGAFNQLVEWEETSGNPDPGVGVIRPHYHYYSLQIPINICYTFTFSDVKVNLFGGPVPDIPLFGDKTVDGETSDIRFGSGKENDLKPFDIAFGIGLGAEYNRFTFGVHAICGLTDRRAFKYNEEARVYQNNITLSLGYFFPLR